MSTKELIDALVSGDAKNIQKEFDAVMSEKIMSRLDDMRQDVAQSLFTTNEEVDDVNRAVETDKKSNISAALRKKNPQRIGDKMDTESDRQEANAIMAGLKGQNGGQPLGLDVRDEVEDQIASDGNFNLTPNARTHSYTPFKPKPPRRMAGEPTFEGYTAEELKDFTYSEEFKALPATTKEAFLEYLK